MATVSSVELVQVLVIPGEMEEMLQMAEADSAKVCI